MSILKVALSIGAGILATAACYLGLSSLSNNSVSGNKGEDHLCANDPSQVGNSNNITNSAYGVSKNKSDALLRKLDRIQVGVINFARFVSEVVRSISLFVRAMRCYEYDVS